MTTMPKAMPEEDTPQSPTPETQAEVPAQASAQPPADPVPTVVESATPSAGSDGLRLTFVTGSKADTEFVFNGHALPFGRSIDEGLRFDANIDGKVSGRHGQFRRDDRGTTWLVEDYGSTNGTFVNGERVVKPLPLKHGDAVILGDANDHGVVIRVAIGDAPLPPETVAEPPAPATQSTPPAPAAAREDGGFFSGIKGAFSRYTERRQLNKDLARVHGELTSAKAAAGSALQTLGVALATRAVLGRMEFAGLPATVALNDAADESAGLDAELDELAGERETAEAAHDVALREADAAITEAEQVVSNAESAKTAADQARTDADTALREALAPWKSAATGAKDSTAAFLTQLQSAPIECDASETAAALRAAAELLDVSPDNLDGIRDTARRAADEATAAEDALDAARGDLKSKQDARSDADQTHRAALAELERQRTEIVGRQSALNARLAEHHIALGEVAVEKLPADFRDDDAWRAATTAVANRTAKQDEQADLERRLAELG